MKALRQLPTSAACYGDGLVGTDQVRRIAAVWANPRVREYVGVCEDELLLAARELEYRDFDLFCVQWVSQVDMDGVADKASRRWRRRDFQLEQDFNGFWAATGRLMSGDGADFKETLDRMVDAERLGDIETAQAEHGDDWRAHLERTTPQLRYDAFIELVRRGAMVGPDGEKLDSYIDFVIDSQTYERQAALLLGATFAPIDPTDRNRFSRTIDGTYVNPAEVVARSFVDHVRRVVVVNSAGVVIDLGRRSRLFTGSARDAALLSKISCCWTGCWIPASGCQIDHLLPFARHGRTNPGNGAPACGKHNRIKEQGFHAWRTPTGEWRLTRPDGTPVPNHLAHWPDPRSDEGQADAA